MELHFKSTKNRVSIDFDNKTYRTGYKAKYYAVYITVPNYKLNEILEDLKRNGYVEE